MDRLRQQIHKLKVDLSKGVEKFKIPLTSEGIDPTRQIMKTEGGKTLDLYVNCKGITATRAGEVFWEPDRQQILEGRYVQAFLRQVTHQEVHDFFGGRIPLLDTVIISGRTSLWPRFEEHLKQTLGRVPTWVRFNQDAGELKRAVVLGALEHQFRWRDLVIEDPGIIGDYALKYERIAPNDWQYHVFEKSGDSENFYLGNSVQVTIGIRTSNGFLPCFQFSPADYYGEDKKLNVKIIFDQTGYLEVEIKNNRGQIETLRGLGPVAILPYKDRPWPLGASKLSEIEPEEVMG